MKKGRVFVGWAKEQGSTTADYKPGDTIEVNEDMQLYAVWLFQNIRSTLTLTYRQMRLALVVNEVHGDNLQFQ